MGQLRSEIDKDPKLSKKYSSFATDQLLTYALTQGGKQYPDNPVAGAMNLLGNPDKNIKALVAAGVAKRTIELTEKTYPLPKLIEMAKSEVYKNLGYRTPLPSQEKIVTYALKAASTDIGIIEVVASADALPKIINIATRYVKGVNVPDNVSKNMNIIKSLSVIPDSKALLSTQKAIPTKLVDKAVELAYAKAEIKDPDLIASRATALISGALAGKEKDKKFAEMFGERNLYAMKALISKLPEKELVELKKFAGAEARIEKEEKYEVTFGNKKQKVGVSDILEVLSKEIDVFSPLQPIIDLEGIGKVLEKASELAIKSAKSGEWTPRNIQDIAVEAGEIINNSAYDRPDKFADQLSKSIPPEIKKKIKERFETKQDLA